MRGMWNAPCFVLTVGLLAVVSSVGAAQTKTPGTASSGTNNGTAGAGHGHGLITELRAIKHLLQEADHDYDGHRAAAVKEVTEVIRGIEEHYKKEQSASGSSTGTTATKGNRSPGAGQNQSSPASSSATSTGSTSSAGNGQGQALREPQAQSDAQLKQAMTRLQAIEEHVQQKHPEIATHLQKAVTELQTALQIK